ncbi:hypothetical protein GGR57DRAFT_502321 [Xylariaceae sp. FL1272]|nr:hypothetical protein GGR57DRAFT_502321 [Xylariaceae sp. FL1272]
MHPSQLDTMPPECVIHIYTHLPGFEDVFSLAATCRYLHGVWTGNCTAIHSALIPANERPFLPHARQLLADLGGATMNSTSLSAGDVRCLVRNSRIMNRCAEGLGRDIAPLTSGGWHEYAGNTPDWPKCRRHPAWLTETEYPRFARAYYRAWSLLELGPSRWEARYKTYTYRQLLRTWEMLQLPYPIGNEGFSSRSCFVPFFKLPDLPLVGSDGRKELYFELQTFQQKEFERLQGENTPYFDWKYYSTRSPSAGGRRGFLMIWDHFAEEFRESILRGIEENPDKTPKPYYQYLKEDIWGDSSDEETYRSYGPNARVPEHQKRRS